MVAAGLVGTIGAMSRLVRDCWTGFVPEPDEVFEPDADELPIPGLMEALGLAGHAVRGVLRSAHPDQTWMIFQVVDRLGGRSTRMAVRLPGVGKRLTAVARRGLSWAAHELGVGDTQRDLGDFRNHS